MSERPRREFETTAYKQTVQQTARNGAAENEVCWRCARGQCASNREVCCLRRRPTAPLARRRPRSRLACWAARRRRDTADSVS